METLKAFQGLERDLRKEANAELRTAARECATALILELKSAAAGSGVPVASRVAGSARVVSDRLPTVSIGGSRRVGARGAPAAVLVWGSEHGPRGEPNHFGVAPSGRGYWIAPTVERFGQSTALEMFKRAVVETMRRYRLI